MDKGKGGSEGVANWRGMGRGGGEGRGGGRVIDDKIEEGFWHKKECIITDVLLTY